jgi:hypothetical protein
VNAFIKARNEIGDIAGYPCDVDPKEDITTEMAWSILISHRNEDPAVLVAPVRLVEDGANRAMICMDESCTLPDDYTMSKDTANRYGLNVVAIVVTGHAAMIGRDQALDAILRADWNMAAVVE